jgi:hypothetical protein
MCTISIISNINYLLTEKLYHYFHKKNVFRVTEYRFWYSIIGRSSEYPVNRVLVAIPKNNLSGKSQTSKHIIEFLVLIPSCQHKFYSKKSIHSLLFSWKHIFNINSSLYDNIRPSSYDLMWPFTRHARSLFLQKKMSADAVVQEY